MNDEPYGFIDEAMLRPPQILGCERVPFLAVIGMAAFVTVIGFGITFPGLAGGVMLASAGVMVLRRIAAHDPFWFAVLFDAARYPRHMPDVLPDPTLPRHLHFVGYDDPPSDGAVALTRIGVVTAVVAPAGLACAFFGLVPALGTLAFLAVGAAVLILGCMPKSRTD